MSADPKQDFRDLVTSFGRRAEEIIRCAKNVHADQLATVRRFDPKLADLVSRAQDERIANARAILAHIRERQEECKGRPT